MKEVSNAYKLAMAQHYRQHAYMVVSIGIISNEAQESAKIISDMSYLSNNTNLFRGRDVTQKYVTFEENVFKSDGSMIFPPENNEYFQLASIVTALSNDVLGSISVQFDSAYDLKGLTIGFGEYYPTSFTVTINNSDVYTYSNEAETFETTDNYDAVNIITITPLTFVNGDNKRLRIESMKMGVGIVFTTNDIEKYSITDSNSFISEELPQIDTKIVCFDKNKQFNVDDENSFIQYLQTGQELNTTMGIELADGSIEWVQMPRSYLTQWSSDTKKISLSGSDRFTVHLTDEYSAGNYIHERTAYAEAESIFSDAGFEADEYSIDSVLLNVTLNNPMPVVSHGEALQLLANACRCALKQDLSGRIAIVPNFENIVDPSDLEVTTDSQAEWSTPENIRSGASIVYADMTQDFFSVDGSMVFLPEDSTDYLTTAGFVSSEVADENGSFTTSPTLTITLPATYTYYGMNITFAGNPPQKFTVNVYNDTSLIDTVEVENPTLEYTLTHEFYNFNQIEFVFDKATANNRVIVQKVSFANLTDYRLTKEAMLDEPTGTIETKIKDVKVKIFTYIEEEQEIDGETTTIAQEVDDNVYYTYNLNAQGNVITFKNPLISTEGHAQQVAEWLGNYYANNITYKVKYRGDPCIEATDYIYMDSDVLNNLIVEVDSHTITYNGALNGSLELRRATHMIS